MGRCSLYLCCLLSAAACFGDAYEQCVLDALAAAGPDVLVGDIKTSCRQQRVAPATAEQKSAYSTRKQAEYEGAAQRFLITAHRPNYALLTWNNTPNSEPFASELEEAGEDSLNNAEIKFQLSIKVPVWTQMFGSPVSLWVAYTNISWWQSFNQALSEVFRETNHEPEIFLDYVTKYHFAGLDWRLGRIGFNHQSNGRGGVESRSWNRIIAQAAAERGRLYLSLRAWLRLPESEKEDADDVAGDDNPDIEDYLGYGDFTGFYQLGKQNFSMILRNNLQRDNRGSVQLDWSFPFGPVTRLRGVVQYFNGYGESLIDYNAYTNRIGFGVMLTDWL